MEENELTPDSLTSSFLQSVTQDGASDVLVDLSELALDDISGELLKNDALTKIPVVGIIVGLLKGALGIRDKLYVRKLLGFFSETSKANDDERKKYAEKIAQNPKESKRASVAILEILDRITSAEKAKMVGKIYRAYMVEGTLTTNQLQYLAEMIDKAYLQDLLGLQHSEASNNYNLVNVGIMNSVPAEEIMRHVQEANDRDFQLASKGMSRPSLPSLTKKAGFTNEGANLVRILRSY
jgi:hypothetical protein